MIKLVEIDAGNKKETYTVIIMIEDNGFLTESAHSELLQEGKKEKIKGSDFWARYDSPNTTTKTQGHYHILLKGNDLYAVNKDDGTAHHRSNRGTTIHKKVADYLTSKGVPVPKDRTLESITINTSVNYKCYLIEVA